MPTSSASEVEQHSEGLETASVALELDDFDELDENTTPENPLLPGSNADSVEARQHTASTVCKEATTSDSSCQTDEFEYMFFNSEKDIKRQREISLTLTVKCCFIRDCHPSKF